MTRLSDLLKLAKLKGEETSSLSQKEIQEKERERSFYIKCQIIKSSLSNCQN